ncbi:hypothetical protein KRR26_23085 [Corallococcus sp. M34]|nr:hypothetical protein [Citreicoccus inhibens]
MDGPAVLAAHAALEEALKRLPQRTGTTTPCTSSPKSLEVVVGQQGGWYFVRVNRRVDQCPGFGAGTVLEFDGFELYAVSPEGRVSRYPHQP